MKFFRNEDGSALVLVAIAMMAFLVVTGLVIDGGYVYMTKAHLQKTANAAVLSGAQELTVKKERVESVVTYILSSHKENTSLSDLDIWMNEQVSVELTKNVKLVFLPIFGLDSVDVRVTATAGLRNLGNAVGAVPLGIDENIPLEYYRTYDLKVDSSGVQYGNFGVLALGGPGASTYEDNFRFGYKSPLKVGDIIDTQTGNIAGKTRAVVQERVNGCSASPPNFADRDCSRIILVPVYRPYHYSSNQMKSIQVTGFAYFYITDPMNAKDTSIRGMFIKRTGTGTEAAGSLDKGAYSIRLLE